MAPKYSHVKKRPTPRKKQSNKDKDDSIVISGNPHVDRNLTQAFSAVSKLERTIARILLLRYEQDIARLFSTRLYTVSLVHLPTLVMRCVSLGGPGWAAHNADSEEIKDFFRAVISMDMRQAGERVATKSVLWSYTALRHFALSNNVPICQKRGLHSLRLLPHYDALKAHLDSLEAQPIPQFSKPPHLGPLLEGEAALEEACEIKFGLKSPNGKSKKGKNKGKGKENENQNESDVNRDRDKGKGTGMGKGNDKYTPPYSDPSGDPYDPDWRPKVLLSYEKLVQTLWRVAKEFDVRGYGLMLREKLTSKWCDCGCSTDHLGEVCERTVREEEEWVYERAQMQGHLHPHSHSHSNAHSHSLGCGAPRGKGKGKQREWDGRGSGVFGWDTSEEEDIWEVELDFGGGPGPGPGGFGHRDEDVEADGSDDDNDDEGHEHGRRHPHGNGHGHRSKQRRDKVLESKPKQQQQSQNPSPHEIALSDLPLSEMSISEIMEFRYLRAEKEKELGNAAFRKGDYLTAVEYYEKAYGIEKEMPTYQLNLGMAWLRLEDWIKAEEACTKALTQHRSPKGYFRRAKARKMLGRTEDAARGKFQSLMLSTICLFTIFYSAFCSLFCFLFSFQLLFSLHLRFLR
ncbi:hypothetical protein K435DRAFT_46250 [Dendrothele bispora CBS 962.96]|uniref:Uncharacterized protein n=1 Tax=Dendrothele bispora (strain CBS 962.96) TaxID=1314807 RepID=A0A4S8KSF9_DENBC|nr:hypothetical protein K435DRAFT_46250 [Dendrothele bispora CBS 962.96]